MAPHPRSHQFFLFLFYFFVCVGVSKEGTDIRTENEPEGMGAIFRMAGSSRAGYGAPGGAWRGPVQQVGKRESEGRRGTRAVLLNIPALPETTDSATQPQAPPHLSLHTPSSTRWVANPSLSPLGRMRSRGGDAGRHDPTL